MAPKYKVERIEWTDSWSPRGWQDPDGLDTSPCICVSVGFVLRETESHVYVAAHVVEGEASAIGTVVIPKVAITKRLKRLTTKDLRQ